jgi:membrane protease YdiL (CAAX protease family)
MAEEIAMSCLSDTESLTVPPPLPTAGTADLRPPRIWYFWGSTLFALLAQLVNTIAATATMVALLVWYRVEVTGSAEELRAIMHRGGWMELAMIVAAPFTVAALWVAIRIARQRFAEYLALRWPARREFLRGLAILSSFLLAWYLFGCLIGQKMPAFVIDAYKNGRASGWLPAVVIAFCVAAPVTEEFFFRGFLFRGWSQSFLRPGGTIVLTSLIWAALHTQYNLFYHAEIFTLGLLFGYLRHRSGSTWLTVALHAVINVISLIEVAVIVAYM